MGRLDLLAWKCIDVFVTLILVLLTVFELWYVDTWQPSSAFILDSYTNIGIMISQPNFVHVLRLSNVFHICVYQFIPNWQSLDEEITRLAKPKHGGGTEVMEL